MGRRKAEQQKKVRDADISTELEVFSSSDLDTWHNLADGNASDTYSQQQLLLDHSLRHDVSICLHHCIVRARQLSTLQLE